MNYFRDLNEVTMASISFLSLHQTFQSALVLVFKLPSHFLQLLSVMNAITPGMFRLRGMLLLEMHCAQFFLCKKEGVEDMSHLRTDLEEAVQILSWEPENSPEGVRAKTAKAFLAALNKQ